MKKAFKANRKSGERFKDVDQLLQRIENETPAPGDYLFDYKLSALESELKEMDSFDAKKKYKVFFSDLPISNNLVRGLAKRNFNKMTEIQRCTIPHALSGRDIMAASKTGSGKTLAYLIPVIERLYVNKWTVLDGLGALIILPTRELAIQVFQVFNSISTFHEISVGLIIGGKDLEYEKKNIHIMNVLICTPGRLLQHIEESPGFSSHNLKTLVLDEADMILEMGFANTLRAILKNLPSERQTMLFSATLSKNIQELGRLSLNNPEFIFLHVAKQKDDPIKETNQQKISELYELPNKLEQFYMKMGLEDKLDNLFSFIKSHLKSKILIFFSTCKQVRFAYEAFKKLRLGIPLLELHGRQKQTKRMAIFFTFSEKRSACLMTTNIAARGLDFPFVDWIVQVDIPENAVTYIHRIGRTARYKAGGKTLLFITPQEIKFLDKLKENKIEIKKIEVNPKRALTIKSSLQSFVSENIDLKYLAQRAFISYMRFVFLATDKEVFDVKKINANEFSESLGLVQIPIIKFSNEENENSENALGDEQKKASKLQKLKEKIKMKKKENSLQTNNENNKVENDEKLLSKSGNKEKLLKKRKRLNTDVLSERFEALRAKPEEGEEIEDDLLVLKKGEKTHEKENKNIGFGISKRQLKKIKPDGHFQGRNKIMFDEKGNKFTLEEIKLKGYKENEEKAEKEQKDFMKDYKRKVILNKENDDLNEVMRRKQKRKKKQMSKKIFELEKHHLLEESDEPEQQYDEEEIEEEA